MKKLSIIILMLSIFISYGGVATAAEQINANDNLAITEDLGEEYHSDEVKEETYSEGGKNYVDSTLENEGLYINTLLKYDEKSDKISVNATLKDNYGNDIKKTFNVDLLEIYDQENFKAVFIDQESGEEYLYDTTELKASVWPIVGVIVGFIAKQGLKKAIKK